MIQLFNGMQSSLSMVYDREVGSMRVLLSRAPIRAGSCSLEACSPASLVSLVQVYVFLAIARFWEVEPPWLGYLTALPAFMLVRADARRDRPVPLLARPAAREFRRA